MLTSEKSCEKETLKSSSESNQLKNDAPKKWFLTLSLFSKMGDRMWTFAAYLLLAKAFPDQRLVLGGFFGLSIAISTAICSSWTGGWIDRSKRLTAATTCLVIQNISVAVAATAETLCILWPFDIEISPIIEYLAIAIVTLFSCIAMVASIGHQICIDRDWVPEIFKGDALTSVNAWVRRIDQFAMLAGPVVASLVIDYANPWVGGVAIAVWNILSVFVEYYFMKKIYNFFPSLSVKENPKDVDKSGMADWILAYSQWYNSPVFLPGLALAILFSNIFQLSYLAQAYSTSHCVSTTFIAVIWIIAGICGFSSTIWYESWVKSYGLTKVAILGAILHFSFVIITVVGLFVPGSMYIFYLNVSSSKECPQQMNETALEDYEFKPTDDDNWIMDYSTPCTPPESILSILIMLFACALSRVGLWTFDLAVNQMFQEWVDKDKRGKVSGAQNGMQYIFDCVHYGLVFVWSEQCEYGNGVIITAFLMLLGYGSFIQQGLTKQEHEALPTNEKPTSREDIVLEA